MWGNTRKSLTALLAAAALSLAMAGGIASYSAGTQLIERSTQKIGPPPVDLPIEAVTFESAGSRLAGWFIDRKPACGLAVLMHGLRADRASMLARARLLRRAGYAALLFDFQAHGESDGDAITFGFRESKDAEAAIAFAAARRPGLPIVVVGSSLGVPRRLWQTKQIRSRPMCWRQSTRAWPRPLITGCGCGPAPGRRW